MNPQPSDVVPARVLDLLERVPANGPAQFNAMRVMDWYIRAAVNAGAGTEDDAVPTLAELRRELIDRLTLVVEGGVL